MGTKEKRLILVFVLIFIFFLVFAIRDKQREDQELDQRCGNDRSLCIPEEFCWGTPGAVFCGTEWKNKTPEPNSSIP